MNYAEKLTSKFYGIMGWDDCYALFSFLEENSSGWFLYNIDTDTGYKLEFILRQPSGGTLKN